MIYAPTVPGVLPGGTNPAIADAAYNDRDTGDDVRNDWEFTVVAAVTIDPPPPAPPAEAPAEPVAAP
jgi:hypothetical protein